MCNKLLLRTFEAGHIEIWRQLKEVLSKKSKNRKPKRESENKDECKEKRKMKNGENKEEQV